MFKPTITLAFLAPCAVSLLPCDVIAFVSRNSDGDSGMSSRVGSGLKLALLSIAGILLASQVLKHYMKWITIVIGIVLVELGILML